jgi:protein-S-isoprenylcysteine O-methyltransferase Ste14
VELRHTTEQGMSSDLEASIARRAVQVFAVTGVQAAILFLAAGRLDWPWGWVFIGLYLAGMATNAVVVMRHNPQVVAQRARAEGMKNWDKIVGGTFGLLYFFALPLVAGLDARFGWTGSFALAVHLTGILGFVLGFALIIWSMAANAHFTTVVRVQADRGHAVCDAGPYRYVRHPGYVGALLHSLAAPLILGSLWALIPGGLAALFMVLRTALEDRTLHAELPGYAEYACRTPYRLLPGVW